MNTVRLCGPKGSLYCLQTVLKRLPAGRVCFRQSLDLEGKCGVCVACSSHSCMHLLRAIFQDNVWHKYACWQ